MAQDDLRRGFLELGKKGHPCRSPFRPELFVLQNWKGPTCRGITTVRVTNIRKSFVAKCKCKSQGLGVSIHGPPRTTHLHAYVRTCHAYNICIYIFIDA